MTTSHANRGGRPCWVGRSVGFAIVLGSFSAIGWDDPTAAPRAGSVFYYSTAAPPRAHAGPGPDSTTAPPAAEAPTTASAPVETPPPAAEAPPLEAPRVEAPTPEPAPAPEPPPIAEPAEPAQDAPALASRADRAPERGAAAAPAAPAPELDTAASRLDLAKQMIADSRERFRQVEDYTCTFAKRERIGGRMSARNVLSMKAKTRPMSVYFKFQTPNAGREAIYVHGQNGGKALVHDVGLGKLVAGTLALDPRSARAMDGNRHPITEAGLGNMIDTIHERWSTEMSPEETKVTINPNVLVQKRPCTMIESTHPQKRPGFLFYSVRVYIDKELGLPIHLEGFDWPKRPGAKPELVEEYSYLNLRLNVGLKAADFDPANRAYSFGRF